MEEKSTYETAKFLDELEEKMGFPIKMIQVDNGYEFVMIRKRRIKKQPFKKCQKRKAME